MHHFRLTKPRSSRIEPLEARIAPATFLVLNPDDNGTGSLRQAILDANAAANTGMPDVISFASIPTTGPFVIQPLSPLPVISEALIIDGYTAPNTSVNTLAIGTDAVLRVEIDASLQGAGHGLVLGGTGGSTVQGLVIRGTPSAINDNGHGVSVRSDNNVVAGNFIGTDVTGTLDFGNRGSQVSVGLFSGVDNFTGNVIGGTAPAARNILSGGAFGVSLSDDSFGTVVQGNLIGTDRTGTVAIPNNNAGIGNGGTGTIIGGSASGAGNVISGNDGWGINTSGSNTTIQGNIIGLDAAGASKVPNKRSGVNFSNGAMTALVGGASAGEGNIISGNDAEGIEIGSNVGDGPGDNITVRGNKIGTDAAGMIAFGNGGAGIGVYATSGAIIGGTNPGEGNVIAFNGGAGVLMTEFAGPIVGVTVSRNSIASNAGLGIDLGGGKENFFGVTENDNFDPDQGPNGLTNSPTLANLSNSGTDVSFDFSISAQPGTNYRIEFFALAPGQVGLSGSGQGAVFLGSQQQNTDGAGQFLGNFSQMIGLPADSYFSATITDTATGQTSEFSPALGDATTYTWNGAQSSDWFDPLNWAPNGVPGAFDTAIHNNAANPIQLNGDASVFAFQHDDGSMLGTGQLIVRNSLTWTGGSQDGPGLVLIDGATGTFNSGAGPLVWSAGNFTVAGALTLAGSGLAFNEGMLDVGTTGILTLNAGVIDQDGVASPSVVSNLGKIEKLGTGAFGLETTQVDNSASIESRAGVLRLTDYTGFSGSKLGLTGGNIQTGGAITLDAEGELFGTGTITGNLVNNGGSIYVGIGEVTGILNLTGDYTQSSSGTLAVQARGTTAGNNYDQLAVGGTASIDGLLLVTILPGYAPALGHTLNVLTSSGLTGAFFSVVGEGAFATSYTATNAQLVRNGLSYTWDAGGGGDTSWFNPLNWSPDGLPGTDDVAMLNTSATITLDTGDATVGDFIQSNGTLTGSKTLNIIGGFSWNGGTQNGTGMTHPGAESSTVLGGVAKTLDTRTLFVQGSGSSNSGSALTLNNAAQFQVGGVYEVLIATPFQSGGGGTVVVNPESTLRKIGAAGTTIPAGLTFTQNGVLEVLGGTFSILAGGGATDAVFRVMPGNTLNFNSAAGFALASSVLFEGGGTVALIGGTLTGSTANVSVAANTTFSISGGAFAATNTTFSSNGPLQWSGGSLSGTGNADISDTFNISGNAAKTLSEWVLNIEPTSVGSWNGTGNLSVEQNAQINVGGTVNYFGSLDVLNGDAMGGVVNILPTGSFSKSGGGTAEIQIPFNSAGVVTATVGGTLQFSGGFTQTDGFLSVGSGSFIASSTPLAIQGGRVFGEGTINAAVNNLGGFVSPGNGLGGIGVLTITGDYVQGSVGELFIEAQGTAPGTGYDQLQVGGTATLNGQLTFAPIALFNPVAPSTFNVLTSTGTRTGTFATTSLPGGGSATYAANGASVVFAAAPTGFVVTTTNDTGPGSLRQAILDANANGGLDTITFNIPGGGVQTIAPASVLPAISDAVILDAYSQPGAIANALGTGTGATLLIELRGSGAGSGVSGLTIDAGGSTVRGFVINDFRASGTVGGNGILVRSDNNLIEGNFIGTTTAGSTAFANARYGISIEAGASGNTIGGTTAGARNLISGNNIDGVHIAGAGADGNMVLGNLIGTDAGGTLDVGNAFQGVLIASGASNNTIGGTTAAARNIISGNNSAGVFIQDAATNGNMVVGNYIGTTVSGAAALGNGTGVFVFTNATGNFIGGTTAGSGNVISGNTAGGVTITGGASGNTVQGNFIGTNAAGSGAVPNPVGVSLAGGAQNNLIGGTTAAARNIVSGNSGNGLNLYGTGAAGNTISGNYIGLNAAGTAALANTGQGIDIAVGSPNNVIGGTAAGAGNVISGNTANGVAIRDPGSTGNRVEGNIIGLDAAGTVAFGNGTGIGFFTSGSGNFVGDGTTAGRNIISGNASNGIVVDGASTSNNRIRGNYIGTDVSGTLDRGNTDDGIFINGAPGTIIGGTGAGDGNLLSGNNGDGIEVFGDGATGTVIQGNRIGTNAAGTAAIANTFDGIRVRFADGVQIGGAAAGAGNVISGNAAGITVSDGADGTLIAGNLIGTDAAGMVDLGNNGTGINVVSGATNSTIGGTAAGARNVISGNTGSGVFIGDAGTTGTVLLGNIIGLDAAGNAQLDNGLNGIQIGAGADGTTIGGTVAGARNVISGNRTGIGISNAGTTGTAILGNYIGTDATGMLDRGNNEWGVFVVDSPNVIVGGVAVGAGNVISGMGDPGQPFGPLNWGIAVSFEGAASTGARIEGNLIGLNAAGTAAITNRGVGVEIKEDAPGAIVGGAAAGARNVISGNLFEGVGISRGGSATVQGNFIGTDITGAVAIGNDTGVYFDSQEGGTATIEGNVIAGNQWGIYLYKAAPTSRLVGNLIGTNAAGTAALGNSIAGVFFDTTSGVTLGGTGAGDGNVIAGNAVGVEFFNDGTGATANNQVLGNRIGTRADGTTALGNTGSGISIGGAVTGTVIGGLAAGAGNVIAFNGGDGVEIAAATATGNSVRGNLIHSNTGLGIDLGATGVTVNDAGDGDTGANGLQNFPVLTSATRSGSTSNVSGSLSSTPGTSFFIDFYASSAADPSGFGEGNFFLGDISVVVGGTGTQTFNFNPGGTPLPAGTFITAVATDVAGNSSEFSVALPVMTTFVWDGGAGTSNWFDPINWDLDSGVPGAADTAILNIASTINLTTGVSVSTFTQTAGTVTGVGNMTVGTSFTWSGGTQSGAATLIIGAGATATLSGSGTKTLDSRFIQNDGTLTITGSGALSLLNGPTITNNGIWDYQSDADLRQDDTTGALFKNTGGATLRKSTGNGGAATVIGLGNPNLAFENDGTVDISAGNLTVFSSGGAWNGSPSVAISAGATFGFTGGSFSWNSVPTLSGGGTLDVGGAANVTLAGGTLLTVPAGLTFTITGSGSVIGSGDVMVDGALTFAGGILGGGGTTSIGAGATFTLSGAGAKTLDTRALTLDGNTTATSSGNLTLLNGAVITNNAIFDVQSDFTFLNGAGGGSFANSAAGTLRKSTGAGSTVWNVPFTSAGIVQPQTGTILFTNDYTQTAGDTQLGGGLLAATTPLALQGGQLTGSGPVGTGINNTGATIRPGGTGAAGIITISGDYTQSGAGVLACELGGTAGGQFDALSVTGTATLGGTLNIANISGFTPSVGNTFRVVGSANNPGTFTSFTGDTTNLIQLADATGLLLQAVVGETDVSLSGGDLVVTDINGGTNNDTLTVVISGTSVRVRDLGNQLVAGTGATQVDANTVDVPLASITGNIQFNTLGGDDTLTVDFGGGNFSDAIVFTGGANTAAGDKLSLTGGGQFATAVFNYTNANDGSVDIAGNATISYTGLEPITSTIMATAVTLNYSTAAETITVTDSGTAGSTLVSSTQGEATTFINPSDLLTINAGTGDDTINVEGTGSGFAAALTIDGQAGADAVNFQTNATTIGGLLTVLSENVNFTAAVTSAGLTTDATVINVSATLNHGAANATFSGAATLTGNGTIRNSGGALRLTGSGFTSDFSGTIDDLLLAMADSGTLSLTQNLNVSDSLLIQSIGFITASGAPLAIRVAGNVTSTDTTGYTNTASTITLTGSATTSFTGPGSGTQGSLAIDKTGAADIAQLASDETFAGIGVSRGVFDLNGRTAITSFFIGGGTLSGIGTIVGDVSVLTGTVSPGGSGTAGTLTISGNYTQDAGGVLAMDVGGLTSSDFDQVLITGALALGGGIEVTLINNFVPSQGSSLPVILAGSVTGVFATETTAPFLADIGPNGVTLVVPVPVIVPPKDPFTFFDQNGDKVKVSLTGKGSLNVILQGGATDNADIFSIELIGTDLTSNLSVAIVNKAGLDLNYTTTIDSIFTGGALQHVGGIKLGKGVTLGDGVTDALPELRVTGKMNTLILDDLAPNAFIKLGEALPYNLPGTRTPDTYNNRPTLIVGDVLGAGVNIEVLGDGTPEGVGGGGFAKAIFHSWGFNGFLRTTQSIGSFLVQTGDFFGVLEVDKFSDGTQTTANVGTMQVANGSWGSSGSEIEGNIGSFNAQEFLAGATITAGSIGSVKTTGALAGTFILTDPDAPGVPTYTVNSDFAGRIVSAQSIKKLKIKGNFTGSLEAPSIGSITAFAFLGTAGVSDITTTAGKLGLLTATEGILRDYTIVTDAAFSGIKVKLRKLGTDTVGVENVSITAASIGNISVDLATDPASTGVDLTGIRNSEFITTATGPEKSTRGGIGNVIVKLKGAAGGDGIGIKDSTFDARVLAGEFTMGAPASTVNPLGNLSVKVSGFGGVSTGLMGAAFEGDVLGTTAVTVTRGSGGLSARGVNGATFTSDGAIGALGFSGDVTENMVTNLQVLAGGKIAGLKVAAKTPALGSLVDSAIIAGQSLVLAGSDKDQMAALAAAALGAVSIGGSLVNSKLVAGASIGAVSVGADATGALILAGARLGGDFTIGDGNETFHRAAAIASVTVTGALTRSSIVAGIASTNATFGDADDILAAVAGTLAQSSSIGALEIGAGSGTNAMNPAIPHAFAIQAAAIRSLVNAGSIAVNDFADALFLDAGTAGEDADDVLVRLIP